MARVDTPSTNESTPRHPYLWAALLAALATLTLAWPALSGGFLVNTRSDQYIAGFAFREFAATALRNGDGFPLWNPYLFGGMPYVAAMHGDIFYPTFLLRMLLPTDIAMTWGFVIHMVLAGFFTFGFLRATGVRFEASIVGGVAYLMSGPIASYASPGHDGKLFVSTLLPAALWLLVLGIRKGRRSAWGLLAIVVGLAVLSPHPQLLQYMLLVMGCYALWLTLVAPEHTPGIATSVHRSATGNTGVRRFLPLFAALVAIAVGGLMGTIQYLSLKEYTPWSPRAGGTGWEHATSYSFPLEETINTYLPQFSGILDNYWGINGIHFHSEYLGAAVLVLALLGIGGGLVNRHRRHGWFWLGALIIALLWAWGGNTPFYHIVYNLVPGTKFFRAPSTMLYVVSFATCMLAAFGAERVLNRRFSMRYVIGWAVFAVVVGVLAMVGGFTNIALSIRGEAANWILQNEGAVQLGAWRSALAVLAVCGVMLLMMRERIQPHIAGWAIVGIVALDLWSIARHYWQFSDRAEQLYASDSIVEYIKAQPQPGRVLPLLLGTNASPRDPFLTGDAFMYHDVRNTMGYHGNQLGRYQQLYGHTTGGRDIVNPNFWALTNTRYLYTDVPELPVQGATLVAGPTRNAAGTMAYLYRLPGDNPPAWVTPLIVKLDDETARATLLDPRFDVRRAAIFDPDAPVNAKPVDTPPPAIPDITATVNHFEPGEIDITLSEPAPAGAALVVSENYYPGWQAEVDGRPATIGRADFVLIGVELPEGAQSIQLRFDSAPYHTGKLVTLVAVLIALLAWLAGLVADRRVRPGVAA